MSQIRDAIEPIDYYNVIIIDYEEVATCDVTLILNDDVSNCRVA